MLLFFALLSFGVNGQCLKLGADLSYVNTILNNGGNYQDESGNLVEPFAFFSEKGNNIVRLRLWHTPSNIMDYCGNPIQANNLQDVLDAAAKVVQNNMELMLAFHYGDYFNDPGKQPMPAAWEGLEHGELLDSIYQYTFQVLNKLFAQGTTPSIVGIGNETTWGFIDATKTTDGWKWPEDADKFNIAIQAVNDFNDQKGTNIKKAVHFTENSALWLGGLFENHNVKDFDIIGISFYPYFSPDTDFDELGHIIEELISAHNKEVMIFETGYVWKKNGGADNYGNIFNNNGNVFFYPDTPDGQKQYLKGLCSAVKNHGGTGIIYWEPAYISSDMCTKWGQGSPYENVSFFDYANDNRALPAFDFYNFCKELENQNDKSVVTIAFPNPLTGQALTVESLKTIRTWVLYDLSGNLIKEGIFSLNQDENTIQINDLASGYYILKLGDILGNIESLKVLISEYK